jgi:uncharacterized protein YcbK (DUF882 family)
MNNTENITEQHPSQKVGALRSLRKAVAAGAAAAFARYWQLPRRRRRVVGWCVLLCFVAMLCLGGYGLYRGGAYVGHWIAELVSGSEADNETDSNDFCVGKPKRDYRLAQAQGKKHFNYTHDFNDINDTQLTAATRIGITPIANREDAERLKSRLVLIRTCQYYKVDPLQHSIPYLVPEAADLLTEIGRRFQEYTGNECRFIITSLLRTREDVKKLKRQNGNASKNSCHFYATTFDITYNRFDRKGSLREGRLKEDLARALYDLHSAGYCYVKYERKQACFHVTVRP